MNYIYPFIISFILIFLSELGDKTQILVLSFATKNKTINILLGVALGTLLSHGIAIMLGSQVSYLCDDNFIFYVKLFTYISFLLFGLLGFIKSKNKDFISEEKSSSGLINFFNSITKSCILLVAITIAIGEFGDKTFLASIGLGIEYPAYKISLICGSILGMVISDSIAIFFGKWLSTKISSNLIELLSNIIFILFGIIGIIGILLK